jgi:CheY-like chemotaxis protein
MDGGFDACARLRALPGGAAMPVLIMTALNHAAVKRMLSIRE